MKVIAGSAKGIPLKTIKEWSTRPTIARVKESLFNIIQTRIPEAVVLDCFSGSGSLCIECLSRGAKEAVFFEQNPQAVKIILENLKKTKLLDQSVILQGDARKSLSRIFKKGYTFDIIFLDPPHKKGLGFEMMERISNLHLLHSSGIIVAEHHTEEDYPEEISGFILYDRRQYGNTTLSFYKGCSDETDLPREL